MTHPTIGIIGGSGLYDMAELTDREERTLSTPFGDPSGAYIIGTLRGQRVAFLARHGAGHRILPSELNFRANIFGFKLLGVERNHTILPNDVLFERWEDTLNVAYKTAWASLADAGLQKGERLLVQAGSSGTGQAAIDIGRYLGAEIYATASRAKHDHLRELGAEPLAYDDAKIGELGAAVVFDPVLGDRFELSLSALAPTGRLVTCGALDSPMVSVNMWAIVGKRLRIIGSGGGAVSPSELDRIIGLVADGSLEGPVVDRELPLDQAAEAHRLIEERQTFGKVVLKP